MRALLNRLGAAGIAGFVVWQAGGLIVAGVTIHTGAAAAMTRQVSEVVTRATLPTALTIACHVRKCREGWNRG